MWKRRDPRLKAINALLRDIVHIAGGYGGQHVGKRLRDLAHVIRRLEQGSHLRKNRMLEAREGLENFERFAQSDQHLELGEGEEQFRFVVAVNVVDWRAF